MNSEQTVRASWDSSSSSATEPAEAQVKKGPHAIIALEHASAQMAAALEKKGAPSLPKQGELVRGKIVSISKNGVVMDIGGYMTGLVRGRELEDESGQYSKLGVGDDVEATVVDLENEQGMLELSFRQAGHRKAWDHLQTLLDSGETVDAKIIDANKGGLMVKVGNVEGFLPVSHLTTEHYPRVEGGDKNRILDRLKSFTGETFSVKVITVKEHDAKLIVSEKLAWEKAQQEMLSKFEIGKEIEGTVTGIVDFGVFVEFGQGLEGLVHISELAWQRIDDPHDIVKVGSSIRAKIIAIENGRVSLSVKRLAPDPWKQVGERYAVGQKVEGKVIKLSPYGAFIELDNDIHGLAHISALSDAKVSHPSDVLKVGAVQKFKIISLEPAAHRLGLELVHTKGGASSKQAQTDADSAAGEKDSGKKKAVPTHKAADGETEDAPRSEGSDEKKEESATPNNN